MELQTICWYGGIGRRNRLKICRTFVRAGSSPATSIVMNRNPQFQLAAEVDSFFPKSPIIASAEEILLLKSICVEMLPCPSHSWISFRLTLYEKSNDAQL